MCFLAAPAVTPHSLPLLLSDLPAIPTGWGIGPDAALSLACLLRFTTCRWAGRAHSYFKGSERESQKIQTHKTERNRASVILMAPSCCNPNSPGSTACAGTQASPAASDSHHPKRMKS